jgi:hypothetical protein
MDVTEYERRLFQVFAVRKGVERFPGGVIDDAWLEGDYPDTEIAIVVTFNAQAGMPLCLQVRDLDGDRRRQPRSARLRDRHRPAGLDGHACLDGVGNRQHVRAAAGARGRETAAPRRGKAGLRPRPQRTPVAGRAVA